MTRNMSPSRMLNLPIEIRFAPTWGVYEQHPSLRSGMRPFFEGAQFWRDYLDSEKDEIHEDPPKYLDPWKTREEFFDTAPEYVDGFVWGNGRIVSLAYDLRMSPMDLDGAQDFCEWQALLRRARQTPEGQWHKLKTAFPPYKMHLLNSRLRLRIEQRERLLVLVVDVNTVLDAIVATIKVDNLLGHKFTSCRCCSKLFRKPAHRRKLYCSWKCAHRIAVRRYRSSKSQKTRKKVEA